MNQLGKTVLITGTSYGLVQHPKVESDAVVGKPDAKFGQRLKAVDRSLKHLPTSTRRH